MSRRRRGDVSRQSDNQFTQKSRGRLRNVLRNVSGSHGDISKTSSQLQRPLALSPRRWLGDVAETSLDKVTTNSPRSRGERLRNISGSRATSPRRLLSCGDNLRSHQGDVSRQSDNQFTRKSRRRLRDVSGSRGDISKTSSQLRWRLVLSPRRRLGDVTETSLDKVTTNSPNSPGSRRDDSETSPRHSRLRPRQSP